MIKSALITTMSSHPVYRQREQIGVKKSSHNKLLKVGIIGTIVAALCCFTPVLVFLLGALGLASLVTYLDFFLIPTLIIFAGMAFYGFVNMNK